MSRHHLFNPEGLPPASGFSYGALTDRGRTLYIAGLIGQNEDLSIPDDIVDQFAIACRSVAAVIVEAGGEPTDLVAMTIYTTDLSGYRANLKPIGAVYREVFGKHFPTVALIGVNELFEPQARLELVCVAVVPDH